MLNGIGFGRVVKTKKSLLYHRWILSAAVVLTLLAVFLVMLPSAFRFYIDPDVMFFSNVSITTVIHGIVGVPAMTTAVIYAFGDLPMKMDAAYCDSLDSGHWYRCVSVSTSARNDIETKFHPSCRRTPFSL